MMTEKHDYLISIIVPIYNVEQYLRDCLESIIHQTYHNLEILLVDDGSPDQCGEICDEYANKDKRIVVIHQHNQGISGARNAALDIAKGDYFLFVDGDDSIELNACEIVLTTAIEQDADLICFGYNKVTKNGVMEPFAIGTAGKRAKQYVMKQLVWHRWIVSDAIWNKFYSRKLFEGVRFPVGRSFEDLATLYKLIHNADTIYMLSNVLYNYSIREGSITNSNKYYDEHVNHMLFYKERLEFLREYYPALVDIQLSMIFKKLIIDTHKLRKDQHGREVKRDLASFLKTHKDRFLPIIANYFYYYCRAFLLRIKRAYRK